MCCLMFLLHSSNVASRHDYGSGVEMETRQPTHPGCLATSTTPPKVVVRHHAGVPNDSPLFVGPLAVAIASPDNDTLGIPDCR